MSQGSVSIVYSGNGAHTVEYALGLVILKHGENPESSGSWIDYNRGGCDGSIKNGPEFAATGEVYGPGVARFTKSADGSEDWMIYHAKTFSTYNRGPGTPGQQDNNGMWSRYINAKPIGWREVVCSGQTHSIPDMGTPPQPGDPIPSPSGDPGLTKGPHRIEAEAMIPFGFVMGEAFQAIPRIDGNPEVILAPSPTASNGEKVTLLDALAAEVPTSPKRSGLIWRNSIAGSSLTIASASTSSAQLDLYIDAALITSLNLPATGGPDLFQTTQVPLAIPLGAELRLVYEAGKSTPANLDYIEINP